MRAKKVDETTRQFFINQIVTTKEIIKRFSETDEFSPTMLLNSLLSLVVLPFEQAKKQGTKDKQNKVFPGKYTELVKKLDFETKIFNPISKCEGSNPQFNNRTIYSFANKFRNGIAHQNLSVIVNENREILITIYNVYSGKSCSRCKMKSCTEKGLTYRKSGIIDFQITVTIEQLQRIATYIANSYLNAIQGGN